MAVVHLVCYDVTDDHKRSRLAAWLQAFGDRVQDSVFSITSSPEEWSPIWMGAIKRIDVDSDRLAAYPLCPSCHALIQQAGQTPSEDTMLCYILLPGPAET